VKIAHVVGRPAQAFHDGAESVRALARLQQARGDEARVLWVADPDAPGPNDVTAVSVRRFAAHGAAGRAAPEPRGEDVPFSGLLRALLAENGPDVLHCHAASSLGATVRTAAMRRRIPYVIHLHGGDAEWPSPGSGSGRTEGPAARAVGWGRLQAALFGERRILDDAALILTDSIADRERALAEAPGCRVEALPRGVDVAAIRAGNGSRARARLGIPDDVPVLLTIGPIGPRQNQEALVDVLVAMPAAHVILAGSVEAPGYDDRLRVRARAFAVEMRMHDAGPAALRAPGFADLYAAANAFVLPFREGASDGSVLEAWAACVPVVVTRCSAGLVVDGDTGLVVETGDTKVLSAAVSRVLHDETLRCGLTGRALRLVAMRHDWPAVTARLDGLYREAGAGEGKK
jgi:glycosyltransferase involved in cell wall biosynthesis